MVVASNVSIRLGLLLVGVLGLVSVWKLHRSLMPLLQQDMMIGRLSYNLDLPWMVGSNANSNTNAKSDTTNGNFEVPIVSGIAAVDNVDHVNNVDPTGNHSNRRKRKRKQAKKKTKTPPETKQKPPINAVLAALLTDASNFTSSNGDVETNAVDIVLPRALQLSPSLFPSSRMNHSIAQQYCCPFWLKKKPTTFVAALEKKKNGVSICTGTCFTPDACDNSNNDNNDSMGRLRRQQHYNGEATNINIYPFKDQSEKDQFPRNPNLAKIKRDNCFRPRSHAPPTEWNTSSQFPFPTLPPMGCSYFTGAGGSGAFQNLYIVPGAKLAFCGIPKVGITNWKQFLRYLMGAHDYLAIPYYKRDLEMWSFDLLAPEVQQQIWNDKDWTFAAILRDPAERLLSAYLDKLKINTKGRRSGSIAKKVNLTEDFSFADFLERLEQNQIPSISNNDEDDYKNDDIKNEDEDKGELNCRDREKPKFMGINWCTDPHWRPQVWGCGMSEKIDRFDFLGTIDHVAEHSKALLEQVDLWESHGKFYRNAQSKRTSRANGCMALFALQDELNRRPLHLQQLGFQQIKKDERIIGDVVGHSRGAGRRTNTYYTPELLQKVQELYRADYEVWNLVNKPNGDWVSGKDILPDLLAASKQAPSKRRDN